MRVTHASGTELYDGQRASVRSLWRRLRCWGEEEATYPVVLFTCAPRQPAFVLPVGTSRGAGIEKGYRYLHHQLRSQLTWFGR